MKGWSWGWLVVVGLCGCGSSDPVPLEAVGTPVRTNAKVSIARAYAPWFFQDYQRGDPRVSVPTRMDFDGDQLGLNNWANLRAYLLPPTVYYAVLETETHYFINYHLFFPRDTAREPLGFDGPHENDGANVQVVVRKDLERVVLVVTQANYFGLVYTNSDDTEIDSNFVDIADDLLLLDEDGVPSPYGRHPALYVSAREHSVYGVEDRAARVEVEEDGYVRFRNQGWILRPGADGERAVEPEPEAGGPWAYQLASTMALWTQVASGQAVGEQALFHDLIDFSSPQVSARFPRLYTGDDVVEEEPLFGPERGASPFAFDLRFREGNLGALFFDPARRLRDQLHVPEPWSLNYVNYPWAEEEEAP